MCFRLFEYMPILGEQWTRADKADILLQQGHNFDFNGNVYLLVFVNKRN